MSVSVTWQGLDELRNALKALPDHLGYRASEIVGRHANMAAQAIRTNYPLGPTGNLKNGVIVQAIETGHIPIYRIRSRAPHAWMFEHGTKRRRNISRNHKPLKKSAYRGRMPAAPESQQMIPTVIRLRDRMRQELVTFVQSEGFIVTYGSPAT